MDESTCKKPSPDKVDVIIIGGGASGLTAAWGMRGCIWRWGRRRGSTSLRRRR